MILRWVLFFLLQLLLFRAQGMVERKAAGVNEFKQKQIISAISELDKKIKKIVVNKGQLSKDSAFLELSIERLNDQIAMLDENKKEQRALLEKRLSAIYKLSGSSLSRFFFSSESMGSLDRNLKILGVIAARDLALIKNYIQDTKDLKHKKDLLGLRLESLKKVQIEIAAEEDNLLREQILKRKILSGIRQSKMFSNLRDRNLDGDREISDLLFKPLFEDQQGLLPPPLQGVIIRKFGLMKGKEHPYTVFSRGIFISAAKGSAVKSVFSGRVSYVGELSGFGTTLILDHGDHYYSVYSHAQDVQVRLGDQIEKSQVIAKIGEAQYETSAGLYFEIRHFSEPYDPQKWMKGL